MTSRILTLARYSFVLFLVLLWYLQSELGQDPVVDDWVLLGLATSTGLFALSNKTFFHVLYFNYLVIWFSVGTINYVIVRLIWDGWDADIITYNRLYALFLVVYSGATSVFTRRLDASQIAPITYVGMDLRFATRVCIVMIVVAAALLLPAVGWTGVFGGEITNENRFDVQVSPLVPRLMLAFPLLACILAYRFARREVGGVAVAAFVFVAFYLMTVFGVRFGFFQTVVTGVVFLVASAQVRLLRAYRATIVALLSAMFVLQLVVPILRNVDDTTSSEVEQLTTLTSFLRSFAGEHRDAAASLVILSESEKRAIADNYVASVVLPIVPSPVLAPFGIDKAQAMEGGAAYFMQRAYNVEYGAIRIGGIAETYLYLGCFGVVLAALVNAYAASRIDRVIHQREPKSFAAVAFAAYGSVWVLYFPASQSNMLLGGFAGFVVMYYALVGVRRLLPT